MDSFENYLHSLPSHVAEFCTLYPATAVVLFVVYLIVGYLATLGWRRFSGPRKLFTTILFPINAGFASGHLIEFFKLK